jgi:hypothetical protein
MSSSQPRPDLDAQIAHPLLDEVERWRRARDIRDYCAAAEQAYPGSPEVSEWLDWARHHGDRIDPLRRPPRKPADPDEISPADLKPFLGRWSPYGPDRW